MTAQTQGQRVNGPALIGRSPAALVPARRRRGQIEPQDVHLKPLPGGEEDARKRNLKPRAAGSQVKQRAFGQGRKSLPIAFDGKSRPSSGTWRATYAADVLLFGGGQARYSACLA